MTRLSGQPPLKRAGPALEAQKQLVLGARRDREVHADRLPEVVVPERSWAHVQVARVVEAVRQCNAHNVGFGDEQRLEQLVLLTSRLRDGIRHCDDVSA